MGHLISVALQAIRRNLLLFVVIVFILLSGKMIRSEWQRVQSNIDELPALQAAGADVNNHQGVLTEQMTSLVRQFSQAGVRQIDAQIRTLDDEISLLQSKQSEISISTNALKGPETVVEAMRQKAILGVEIESREQVKAYLIALRTQIVVQSNRKGALEKLEQLRLAHVLSYAAFRNTEEKLAQTEAAAGVLAKIPFTNWHNQVDKLSQDLKELKAANNRAHQEYLAQKEALARLPMPAALNVFRIDEQGLERAAAPLYERLRELERWPERSRLGQVYQAVSPVLPIALSVLIGWWLVPVGIRALFYFVLAPIAASRPPILITANRREEATSESYNQCLAHASPITSSVSLAMTLAPGDEMLIRPDYCQSLPMGVKATTKLLFDWRHWLTSIAAHLWLLKRLRAVQPAEIVVSSTIDALDEVALLRLGAGEAFVLQPRGLVGMMHETGRRPRVRSHWRLGTLHAWLTLQLRYLAFEGPVTLIVKGCRGVRLESASTGRSISQDATLGFSANASYATVRADPFVPYLRGRQSLLNDKFSGQQAYFLYEEVPRNARPDRQKHNPLEVLLDACLKAFGI